MFDIIFYKCPVCCLFSFLECELHEGRNFSVSWDAIHTTSGTYPDFFLRHAQPFSTHIFSRSRSYLGLPSWSLCTHSQSAHSIPLARKIALLWVQPVKLIRMNVIQLWDSCLSFSAEPQAWENLGAGDAAAILPLQWVYQNGWKAEPRNRKKETLIA